MITRGQLAELSRIYCMFVANSEIKFIPNVIAQSKMRPFMVDTTLTTYLCDVKN